MPHAKTPAEGVLGGRSELFVLWRLDPSEHSLTEPRLQRQIAAHWREALHLDGGSHHARVALAGRYAKLARALRAGGQP